MTRIYLAGPMTGHKDLNFPAFNGWAANLRSKGLEVVNPAELNGGADELARCAAMDEHEMARHWRACMRRDITELVTCEAIYMMPGWEWSRGAKLEHYIAQQIGLKVVYLVGEPQKGTA